MIIFVDDIEKLPVFDCKHLATVRTAPGLEHLKPIWAAAKPGILSCDDRYQMAKHELDEETTRTARSQLLMAKTLNRLLEQSRMGCSHSRQQGREENAVFSHVMVGTNDMGASKRFYDATLATLGVPPSTVDDKGRVFFMTSTGVFIVTTPINGEPACCANGGTIGFAATSPEAADNWNAAGLASGGTACEDPPGVRESALGKLYLAYLRDPAGNKLCALHRMPS